MMAWHTPAGPSFYRWANLPMAVTITKATSNTKSRPSSPSAADTASTTAPRACMRSEEHTSELQSLMRISYAVSFLKKNKHINHNITTIYNKYYSSSYSQL